MIDVDEAKKAIVKKELIPSPEHQPGLLPTWLAEKGVDFVIAGGMGMSAQQLFQQKGIKVVLGALESDPGKAVINHLNGRLATGGNVCDH
jgi:predicted Fe-Mo cluster-binding NifX family protein